MTKSQHYVVSCNINIKDANNRETLKFPIDGGKISFLFLDYTVRYVTSQRNNNQHPKACLRSWSFTILGSIIVGYSIFL